MKRLRKCLNAFANPTNCTNLYGFEARSFGARITRPAYTASVFVCVFFRSISISTNNTSAQHDLSALNPRLGWWAYELVEVNNRVFRPLLQTNGLTNGRKNSNSCMDLTSSSFLPSVCGGCVPVCVLLPMRTCVFYMTASVHARARASFSPPLS